MIDFHSMALHCEASGLSGLGDRLRELTQAGRDAGVSPVLIEILADGTAPEVARIRAMAMVWRALSTSQPHMIAA